jgi:CubicO group peptidase (beta-lactamase class C family)
MPEEVGICADSLKRIDYIAQTVILRKATPGMQILVAKQGKVFYHKAFGYHTYSKKIPVKLTDIYDLASLTKTTSTTLAAMRMYEEQRFKLNDSLKDYLPDTLKYTSLNDVTFKEILTHRTGLSSGMNILKFLQYTNDSVGQFDRYFCDWQDDTVFKVMVAENIWMDTAYADSIWVDLTSQWIDQSRPYKYSDANFNLLYFLLRSMAEEATFFDKYVHKEFYKPLGLQTMGFLPLERFPLSRILPTEDEKYWRRQLLQGYVHDPTAALMGGVAGNAGLFSNANDMAIVYQMLLNGGEYGGKRYFEESTVKLFTEKANNGHRGLGFNKPSPGAKKGIIAPDAPMASFGHTGFTGICAWVDPENELVYIFVSNRVHPKSMNKKLVQNGTRKRIHQVIYDQILPPEIIPVLDSVAFDTSVVAIN